MKRTTFVFWLFLLPALLAFLMVIVIPFFMGIFYSFTDWGTVSTEFDWVGLENYKSMFQSKTFLYSFLATLIYASINILFVNVFAFCFALLVTGNLKGTNIYRSGFFVPNLIGGLVLGYLWRFIFREVFPVIGTMLTGAEIQAVFLTKPNWALLGIAIVSTWQYAGYIMMIYIAGIQNIPASLMEAAQIDGANYLQRLRAILFPMVAPSFTIAAFLTIVNSFKQYDVNVSLTQGGPGRLFMGSAVNSTELLAMNIYNEAFKFNNFAKGQARAVFFFVILVVVSLVQVYFNKRREIEL